ncbi:MAG: NAD(P)/FAD-dependent oxidoreductase [Balneolaceae bacterium]|nr:MAG: NAD(P)/FAD-dependent oxidoreductase [Balneolaceae bacterium]
MELTPKEHIVIVGGGFGGITVAKGLNKPDARITLIDRTNHHLFQPLLYQVATAALSPGDISAPIREIVGKRSNVGVLLGEVTGVDPQRKLIKLRDEKEITFDTLILAPGAQYNYFGNNIWENHAPSLKTISDALNIRERILMSLEEAEQTDNRELRKPLLTFVVVGGGPTGVEMAGAIAEIAKRNMMRDYKTVKEDEIRVFLVEAASQILNGYPASLASKAQQMLEGLGVEVLLDSPVSDIEENIVHLGDDTINTSNIVWAAGVAASPILNHLEAEQDVTGRVKVKQDLSVPGFPDIFVIGDAAYLEDSKGEPLPALAPVAMQQGKFLIKLLSGQNANPENRPAFQYVDKGTMATIGRAKAVADIRGFRFAGFFAWVLWSFVHILFLIGFRNRFRVFIEWIIFYFSFKRGVRLITDRFGKRIPASS